MSLDAAYRDYQAGAYADAETKLAALALREPHNLRALHLGAMVAAKRGDPAMALKRIQASLADKDNLHEKFNTRGNILSGLGMELEAEESFRAALHARPDYAVALANLAAHLQSNGQPDAAVHAYRQLLAREPAVGAYHIGLVQSLIDMNRPDAALAALESAPVPAEHAAVFRARALFTLGRFEDVIGENAKAYSDRTYGPEAFKLSLQVLAMTGAWDSLAGPLIDEVLDRHADSDPLWSVAVAALHRAGREGESRDLFARAPQGAAVLAARAEALVNAGEFAEAETLAQRALALRNGFPPALIQLCFASLGLGKAQQAQAVADIALRANPNNQFFWGIKALGGRMRGQDYHYYFDYDRFVKPYDLSPPEGWADMAAFNAELKAELDALHGFTAAPLDQTLRSGTQTSPNLRFVDSPAIRAFFQAVRPAIADYVAGLGHAPGHAFLRRNLGGFRIRSGWSVRLGRGGHHINHIHPEGWISSAYYVDVPEGRGREGHIKFGEPPQRIAEATGLGAEHFVEPIPGRLVLFPSYLWHGTVPITKDATRMTLPIDILPGRPDK